MKTMERFFRRLALFRSGFDVNGPTPCGYLGPVRNRLLHTGIAFGWMAKGGQYDNRTLAQRTIFNRSARAHFRMAFTAHP